MSWFKDWIKNLLINLRWEGFELAFTRKIILFYSEEIHIMRRHKFTAKLDFAF
jgi:hypothetical protein